MVKINSCPSFIDEKEMRELLNKQIKLRKQRALQASKEEKFYRPANLIN
jgi:hypothetical protein